MREQLGAIGRLEPRPGELGRAVVEGAVSQLRTAADMEHGGIGGAPKFPPSSALELMLAAGEPEPVRVTLDAIAAGGINDQIGGGFARYSVDPIWLVPHFEKMLYDNALLARVYLHGYQALGDRTLAPGRGAHARLGAAGDARARGRLLFGARRRLRG